MSVETEVSPGIGPLGPEIPVLGGCVIDMLGTSGGRVTLFIDPTEMFKGWTGGGPYYNPSAPNWLVVAIKETPVNITDLEGIAKANIRITLYDGDSASPNPVYVAMFGAGNFPYLRVLPLPGDYDFDGGQTLFFGFENVDRVPVNVGFMGETAAYRLNAEGDTAIETYNGFPGTFGLTDPHFATNPHPAEFMQPVAPGCASGVWPVTAWFEVPTAALPALYDAAVLGTLRIGIWDASPGEQYYDFTIGLPVFGETVECSIIIYGVCEAGGSDMIGPG